MSDHHPVIVEAPIGRLRRRPTYKTTRSWRTADWDAICLDFLLADWDSLHNCSDVNQMVKKLHLYLLPGELEKKDRSAG